jgi:outer membrane receptor protein involved in Fe transport
MHNTIRILQYASLLCIATISWGWAQGTWMITGQIVDNNNAAIPYANAALYAAADSALIAGGVSNDDGNFSISANEGNYYLKITFLSFDEKIISNIALIHNLTLGKIQLQSRSQLLNAVTIQSEKSQLELYLDKRVFQVGKDLSNISGSAAEILDNVPSVTVDVEGNISLRGSQNVRILIDGRPSGLTGISTADALRQLQGNLIESIEIITNPSARYDAEGEVGIINIILKKEKQKGVNGSFSVNGGYPHNYGASFNLNFRRSQLNFFSSYGINYRSNPGSGFSYQSFIQPDTTFFYHQKNQRTRSDLAHNLRAGLDYYFNDKNMLTGSILLRSSNGLNTSRNEYLDFDNNNALVRTVVRNEREEEPELNTELALNYRREYARKGQLLTADFKWIENIETEEATFNQIDYSLDSIGFERSRNTENERNALVQIDYIHPYREKGKMEAGFKSTLRVIDNDFIVERMDQENNVWNILPEYHNNLIYTENIHAAYFMIGNEIKRFSWQTGMRGELSDINVELAESNVVNFQNYFNIFPSAHLSYKFSANRTLQLSYSYRLSRPRFRDLMPFSNYSDNRAVFVGNPDLRPEYTNSIEAGYLINWESGSVLSSAYYRYRTGVVERIAIVDSVGFTRSHPVNLSSEDAYGLEFNFSWNPVKWWRLNTNANFYRAITEGTFNDQRFFSDTYTWTNRTTSRITVFRNWDFQTGFNYRAPRQTPQGMNRSLYFIDLGLSHDTFKGNGTLTFAVRDLLNSRKFRSEIYRPDEGYYSETNFQWRARQFLLTFTYRLNKKKESRSQNNEGENDIESGDF